MVEHCEGNAIFEHGEDPAIVEDCEDTTSILFTSSLSINTLVINDVVYARIELKFNFDGFFM